MSTRVKSRTQTQMSRFYHKKSNQLSYAQFASSNFNLNPSGQYETKYIETSKILNILGRCYNQ
jgi:hypothetical protein